MIPLVVLEGRAWDTGLENLWVHVDSEGAIDWVGVVDPTLRRCPTIRSSATAGWPEWATLFGTASFALPNEAALTTWVAHRSHRALEPLFVATRRDQRSRRSRLAAMWHIVGAAVVSAATHVPLLAGSSEITSMRRSQAVLDALLGFGLPVRGGGRTAGAGRSCLN